MSNTRNKTHKRNKRKKNHILDRIGVEKFGSFLTVYSVIIFLLEKTIISEMSNIELVISLSNEKFKTFIMFLLLGLVGIVCLSKISSAPAHPENCAKNFYKYLRNG